MKTDNTLNKLIEELKKKSIDENIALWKRVALDLEKPTRQRRIVNLSRLNRFTSENEIIIVPGKVLGAGEISHAITVAAYSFSDEAKKKITNAKGKVFSIKEFMGNNIKGKGVRIIG